MKITAQKEGKPTIRNIAKLLMNSMYGRFGMRTLNQAFIIVDSQPFSGVGTPKGRPGLKATLDGLPGNTNVAIASAVSSRPNGSKPR